MKLREQKGFTLIEVIVVAGIIAILAGILVPLIFKEIDESKITRAHADVRSISSALIVFRKDTGQWPITATCSPASTIIKGSGTLPTLAAGWDGSTERFYNTFLSIDEDGCWPTTWKGPYMAQATPDPWGNAYVTNAPAFLSATGPVWIISAGPDGILNTAVTDDNVSPDDVGIRLR